jgi:serine/threonine protein kinase
LPRFLRPAGSCLPSVRGGWGRCCSGASFSSPSSFPRTRPRGSCLDLWATTSSRLPPPISPLPFPFPFFSPPSSRPRRASAPAAALNTIARFVEPSPPPPPPPPDDADALVVRLPLSPATLLSLATLLALACLGGFFIYKVVTRYRCACPLCKGTYVVLDKIGSGGFGSVFLVRAATADGTSTSTSTARALVAADDDAEDAVSSGDDVVGTPPKHDYASPQAPPAPAPPTPAPAAPRLFVLKKMPATDMNDATEAQREARELRYLAHPRIVRFVDEFLHVAESTSLPGVHDSSLSVCLIMERCRGDLRQLIARLRASTGSPKLAALAAGGAVVTVGVSSSPTPPHTPITTVGARTHHQHHHRNPAAPSAATDTTISPPSSSSTTSQSSRPAATSSASPVRAAASHPLSSSPSPSPASPPQSVHLSEPVIARWAAQIVSALRYCHSKGVCHRDVKSQNIFVSSSGDIRIGDFGLAKSFDRRPTTVYTEAGTDCYKSPEALLGGRRDGRKADIWALGLVLLELTTNVFTWERPGGSLGGRVLNRDAGAVDALLSSIPPVYSTQLRLLVRKCLTPDADARPSAEELFRFRLLRKGVGDGGGGGGGDGGAGAAIVGGPSPSSLAVAALFGGRRAEGILAAAAAQAGKGGAAAPADLAGVATTVRAPPQPRVVQHPTAPRTVLPSRPAALPPAARPSSTSSSSSSTSPPPPSTSPTAGTRRAKAVRLATGGSAKVPVAGAAASAPGPPATLRPAPRAAAESDGYDGPGDWEGATTSAAEEDGKRRPPRNNGGGGREEDDDEDGGDDDVEGPSTPKGWRLVSGFHARKRFRKVGGRGGADADPPPPVPAARPRPQGRSREGGAPSLQRGGAAALARNPFGPLGGGGERG